MAIFFECFALLMLLFAGAASAETQAQSCADDIYAIVRRDMNIKDFSPKRQDGNIISESCKSWPYNHNIVLSAFAYNAGVEFEKTLIVAMIDKKTKRVVSSYRSVISEDAITEVGEDSLKLDTARYQLATGVRAFGVEFNSSAIGASCGEANWNNELTLLVPKGKELRPVLSLYLYQQKSIQGCLSVQSPDAIWQDASLTIGIEKTNINGFYDLLATATITTHSNGAPIGNIKDRVERHLFRYNGKFYEKGKIVPWWLGI